MKWQIYLYGIIWDSGDGCYDVSDYPENLRVEVDADDKQEAIEVAMNEASDLWGTLIEGTEQIQATRIE